MNPLAFILFYLLDSVRTMISTRDGCNNLRKEM